MKQLCLKQGKKKFHGTLSKKEGLSVKVRVEIDKEIKVYPKRSVGFKYMIVGSQDIIKFTTRRNKIVVTLTYRRKLKLRLKKHRSNYYRQRQSVDLIDNVTNMLEGLTPPSQSQEKHVVYGMS